MWIYKTYCRFCRYGEVISPPGIKAASTGEKLIPVFDLGLQPPANDFCKEDEERAGYAPLQVMYCPRCSNAQLSLVVNPLELYRDYPYTTSRSETMHRHFDSLWSYIRSECEPVSVIEIGSNNGDLLKYAKSHGTESVCGIDPAENLAVEARSNCVQTICGLFCEETAKLASLCVPNPDCIIARHVFGHVDDLHGFIKALDIIANKKTLILIEVPWAKRLLEHCEFDTIYFEHLSYITIRAMAALLENTPFRLHRIHEFPVHGGALGIMLRRRDHASQAHESVFTMLETENITEAAWKEMAGCSQRAIRNMKEIVSDALAAGKTVAGYGASAKATVWINACGFTRKEIKFVTDTTPYKQGCTIPGTDIPVVDPGALLRELPDYAIMWCWNFASECLSKEHLYRERGGQFIIPHEGSV